MSGLATFRGRPFLFGSDYERFLSRVWTSTDGSAWTEVATTGLDRPADILAVSAAPDALYTAGVLRVGPDPAAGPFRPAIWRSTNGQRWRSVTPPDETDNAFVSALATPPGTLIVAMDVDGAGSIWRSLDGGATWTAATVELESENLQWRIGSIARLGDRLVGVGEIRDHTRSAQLIVISTDDGATWASAAATVASVGGDGGGGVVAAAGAFWLATSEYNDGSSNPDACYRDLSACQNGARPVLMRSIDGVDWVEVDLSTLSVSWIERLLDAGDAGMMLVGRTDRTGRLDTWTWSSNSEPPRRPPPEESTADDLPLAEFEDQLTVGARYRFPLYIHCGMGLLGNFNDRWWYHVEGSTEWDPEIDNHEQPPAHWPIAEQSIFGTITLVDADTIEYTIPSGEIIAVYQASTNEPQLCA